MISFFSFFSFLSFLSTFFFVFLVIGSVAALLVGASMKGRGFGWLGDWIVGAIGAFLALCLFSSLQDDSLASLFCIAPVMTLAGAMGLLFVLRLIKSKKGDD